MLEVNIRKKLDNYELVTAFHAEPGCLGILGASGCGKSVTLKCIAGIMTPDEGRICLNGKVLFDSEKKINKKPQDRKIGYLFQSYALFPNMTVQENIAAGIRKGQTGNIGSMLEKFSLTALKDRYPQHLSGGEQQRTALARLLIGEPDVLLLDEPFSALDAYLKEGLQLKLKAIMEEQKIPAILVTHSRDEVYRLSDKLMIMEHGRVENPIATKQLFACPVSKTAARLTGCKNITDVIIKENSVYAPDWNMLFELPEHAAYISGLAIRAHDFVPYIDTEKEKEYIPIQIGIHEIVESPFEWNVMFKKKEGEEECDSILWWKVSKEILKTREAVEKITVLYLRRTGILYLKDERDKGRG